MKSLIHCALHMDTVIAIYKIYRILLRLLTLYVHHLDFGTLGSSDVVSNVQNRRTLRYQQKQTPLALIECAEILIIIKR